MKNPILSTSALLVSTFGLMLTGCRADNVPQPAPIVDGNAATSDPTAVNMAAPLYAANTGAPVTRVAANAYQAAPQSSSESYAQQAPAPQSGNYGVGNSQQNEAYQYNTQQPAYSGDPNQQPQQGYYAPQQGDPNAAANAAEYDEYSDLLDPNTPAATEAPPPLPSDYEQPEAPGPDYMWTPGYWDYANTGYYYVPGVWVAAPYAGALWTPGWWGFVGNRYRWHHGYWGRHVGYYGGINYGFGFIGFGYQGGYWNGDHFFYNRAVNHIEPRYVNNYVYSRNVTVINRTYINNTRVSYAGGPGGVNRRPVAAEFAAQHEVHTAPMAAQIANRREAEGNRQQFFNANHGRPATVFAARPLAADHNVAAPPRTMPSQNFSGRPGEANRPGEPMNRPGVAPNGNMNLQQRQQFDQQRQGMEQQRQQMDQQRQQQQQMQQRQQFDAQHQQQNQQQMQQRQQEQAQQQQRMQQEQQQRQQQQVNQQHEQQQRVQDQQQQQQRQQEQQRQQQAQQQQVQQRQQDQQRQQMQMNQQREQQQRVQEQQHQQQAQQQQQQQRMQQEQQQRQQQQMNQQRAQQEQQQRAQQMQHQQQQIQQQHAAPAAPHMEAPHGAAPHGGPEHR